MGTSLFIEEPPLQVLPTLAMAVGLNSAIVLQQLHYLQRNPKNGRVLEDGERYIFNTYEEWKEYFPFWSTVTIKRILIDLEDHGYVISKQPEGSVSRRKYYRIPMGARAHMTYEKVKDVVTLETEESDDHEINLIPSPSDQIDPFLNGSNRSVPLTENSAKTSSKEGIKFVDWFLNLLVETGAPKPNLTQSNRLAWAEAYEKMVRIDGRTKEQIKSVCTWARNDDFWRGNFFSPIKLRKVKDGITRFDEFVAKMGNRYPRYESKVVPIASEPIGWQQFVNQHLPDCPYATGQLSHGKPWAQVSPDHQRFITDQIKAHG